MSKLVRRRVKKRKGLSKLGVGCISMIISLNLFGVGYAYWPDKVSVQGVVSTGNIDPVFVECSASEISRNSLLKKHAEENLFKVEVTCTGKKMNVKMQNAYPGASARLSYKVKNNGTIPVVCDTASGNTKSPITIESNTPAGVIYGCGDCKNGTLTIRIGEVQESKSYNFSLDLLFHQWNAK